MVLVNFWEARFTRTAARGDGRVGRRGGEGFSEGGEPEVHWNCRRESHGGATARVPVKVERQKFTRTVGGKVTGCYSEGFSEGGEPEVH